MMPKSRSYQEDLLKALRDPEEAKEYLNAALSDVNLEVFILALKDVARANNEENIYSIPESYELRNISNILRDLGYRLRIEKLSA